MDKLQINAIRMYNAYWYAIRFSGKAEPFKAMVSHFKSYGHRGAYWRQGEFNGYGAWIVRKDILEKQSNKFENFESRANIARETLERKEA